MSIDLSIQPSTEIGVDVTTIKLKMKFPNNHFQLHVWDACPFSLKCALALELKHLRYPDLEYTICRISPFDDQLLRKLECKTGCLAVPQMKVRYKNGIEENWLADSTAILKFLDSSYPANSLFLGEDHSLNLNICLLEDWIDEAFALPYLRLLFLNKNNLNKASVKWQHSEASLIGKAKLQMYKQEKINYLMQGCGSREIALNKAYKRLDEELLPMLLDRFEQAHQQGNLFLFGEMPTAADLTAYSFLKLLLELEECPLVSRRAVFQKFVQNIEHIPLNKLHGTDKKLPKHRLTLIGNTKAQAAIR